MNAEDNFLDADDDYYPENLTFAKQGVVDDLKTMLQKARDNATGAGPRQIVLSEKIVQPQPGFCVKTWKLIDEDTEEKFFINVCKTDAIPSPPIITNEELLEVLRKDNELYRVPMSITEVRKTRDKSNHLAYVCDIAINPQFLRIVERTQLFKDFFFTIVAEAMESKYGVKLDQSRWTVLQNKTFMDRLVPHRIENRDIERVRQVDGDRLLELCAGDRTLIKEISSAPSSKHSTTIKNSIPEHRLALHMTNLIAEFLLPGVATDADIVLDVGEDCIVLSCPKQGYSFNEFFDYKIDQSKSVAEFNEQSKILTITMPISV